MPIHTHAAGREIHIVPAALSPDPLRYLIPRRIYIPRAIYPRRMLTAKDILQVRDFFPASIGIRVYICGFAVILFKNTNDIKRAWESGPPDDLGGLDVRYDTLNIDPSAVTSSGHDVAASASSYDSRGCLGLRIKTKSGQDAVTTVMHSFVNPPAWHFLPLRVADWMLKAKEKLSRFVSPSVNHNTAMPAQIETRDKATKNSPLGKSVYLAGEALEIGKITTCYDNPSPILPYPEGYSHDLGLLTGPNLPYMCSPPGVGVITGWAKYEDALDGKPAFEARLDTLLTRKQEQNGGVSSDTTKNALVLGTEYLWTGQAVTSSLLWRTDDDWRNASGLSGSVLCLGRSSDTTIQAVVFQNYQTSMKRRQLSGMKVKGGFLLPQEIRECEIQVDGLTKTNLRKRKDIKHMATSMGKKSHGIPPQYLKSSD